MFLALKNGLGRLAVFFRGLFDEYGGAAAAYSLRRLGSAYSGPLVRVRRDSDDAELDFTSTTQIADWVNGKQETTLPSDVATSSAAYSLRKVKDTYTGNAVRIRRASDNVEVNVAFDTTGAVSASSAITNIVDTVLAERTDFSSSLSPFTATTGNTSSFDESIGGRTQVYKATYDGSGTLGLNFNTNLSSGTVIKFSLDAYWLSSNTGSPPVVKIRQGAGTIGSSDQTWSDYGGEDEWVKFDYQFTLSTSVTSLTLRFDDDPAGTSKVTGDAIYISNIKYSVVNDAGDTTATTLGGFLTEGGNQDAYVHTWYDQSGSGNNATQDTTDDQPKIAEAGAVITTLGKPAINFAVGQLLNTDSLILSLSTNSASAFAVSSQTTLSTTTSYVLQEPDSNISSNFIMGGVANGGVLWVNATEFGTMQTGQTLSGFDWNQSTFQAHINGAVSGVSGTATVNAEFGNRTGIGGFGGGTGRFQGFMQEIITYKSDQSSNRFKIESNINNYYGIYNTGDQLTLPDAENLNGTLTNASSTGGTLSHTGTAYMGWEFPDTLNTGDRLFVSFDLNIDSGSAGILIAQAASSVSGSGSSASVNVNASGSYAFPVDVTSDGATYFRLKSQTGTYQFTVSNLRIIEGGYNGFVETWYDQSGNGYDAEQLTLGDQPKIVEAGSLLSGGIKFNGTNNYFDTTHVIGATSTTFAVCESNFASDLLLDMRDGGGDGLFMFSAATDTFRLQYNASSLTGSSGASGEKLASFLAKDGLQKIHINGTEVGSDTIAGTISVTNTTKIGARSFSDPISSVWDGTMQEIVIYHSDQSANRSGIESNIADEYGITLP